MWLREQGFVPWSWIVDETRSLASYRYADTVTEYIRESVDRARIDLWDGGPPPLIICESRTFGGVIARTLAPEYLASVTATNGQAGGHLHTEVIPCLRTGAPVLYIGDLDVRGADIEANTRRVVEEELGEWDWTRIALTSEQVKEADIAPVQKVDRGKGGTFDAWEVESLGQGRVTNIIRDALDVLLPEPLEVVRAREDDEREQVTATLNGLEGP
jgi:hypothetical protein